MIDTDIGGAWLCIFINRSSAKLNSPELQQVGTKAVPSVWPRSSAHVLATGCDLAAAATGRRRHPGRCGGCGRTVHASSAVTFDAGRPDCAQAAA